MFACAVLCAALGSAFLSENPDKIKPNDMQRPAGVLKNGVLTLKLVAGKGAWYPDGDQGMARPVYAFGEEGKALQNPGPLVRVPVNTEVRITVRNALPDSMWVYGLGEKRGMAGDSFRLAPGAAREVQFTLNEPGVYWYGAKTHQGSFRERSGADSQLNGAIVVDGAGVKPIDRLFLISWWFAPDTTTVSGLIDGSAIAVNGLAYPHTEHLPAVQGEAQHWKFVNMTDSPHPMHLHGFYFRVDADGDGKSWTEHAPADREMAVTHIVSPHNAFALTWVPAKPGNWIMHCHIASHMTSLEGLNKDRRYPEGDHAHTKSSHDMHFMANLVLGITVKPKGALKASARAERPLRLVIKSKPKVYGEYAGYSYVLGGTPEEHSDAMPPNGPVLVLRKDEPVAVTIVNRSHDGAAVHWHGIELESFPDGVPGVSGYQKKLLPTIAPRDSLTVRFTPPRAGTFMYHSHFNENQQIGSGLVGAIVVLPDEQQFDAETDRVLLMSDAGPLVDLFRGPYQQPNLNGAVKPEPMMLKAGTRYRLRLISIRSEFPTYLTLLDGEQPVMWKRIARDGADLPEAQRKETPAVFTAEPGQIADYEFTPQKAGELTLRFGYPKGFPRPPFAELTDVRVIVR